jgi:rod shape determining protein RodA
VKKDLFLPVAFILGMGLTVLSSIDQRLFFLQSLWTLVGFAVVVFFWKYDWRAMLTHKGLIYGLYALAIILLLVAFFTSPVVRNTRSWIYVGPFGFQPVEFAKIALILIYAQYFSRRHLSVARWKNIITSLFIFALPAGLVLLQPDMGSASILFGIWFGFLLVSGLPRKRIAAAVVAFAILGAFGWMYVLKPYQKNRIMGVFYPEENALTVNYSVIQAKIAIGSAGFWGKGYHQGTQTQLGFLTEPANDFVLAALIEEWGLLAGLAVIGAYVYLVFRILRVGLLANQNFEKFFCLGVALMLGLQFLINAGSTIGIFPVVGVTFPFLSYGGSNLLTSFFLLAIINSIARRS